MKKKLLFFLCISCIFISCSRTSQKKIESEPTTHSNLYNYTDAVIVDYLKKYSPTQFFTESEIDSLMVNIVTYIGKKPKYTTPTTRFDSKNRNYYTNLSKNFEMCYLHKENDTTYYYYILRPARSPQGNSRGTGGFFNYKNNSITYLQEVFVTVINKNKEESIAKGINLFTEFITNKNIDTYIHNELFIEWPDQRVFYDTISHEWRYHLDN